MPFQANRIGKLLNGGGDLFDAIVGSRVDLLSAGWKERGLPQAYHQAARFEMNFDFAILDLLRERLREIVHRGKQLGDNFLFWTDILGLAASRPFHLGIPFSQFIDGAAQNLVDSRGNAAFVQCRFDRVGNLLGLGFIGLRAGVHHHEESEQQGDEIGVGNQPALGVLVFRRFFFAGQDQPSATAACEAAFGAGAGLALGAGWTR